MIISQVVSKGTSVILRYSNSLVRICSPLPTTKQIIPHKNGKVDCDNDHADDQLSPPRLAELVSTSPLS